MNDLEGLAEPGVASSNMAFFISVVGFVFVFVFFPFHSRSFLLPRYYASAASTFIIRERKV